MDKIAAMTEGGKRLKAIREAVAAAVKPGVTLKELDQLADSLIDKSGGEASFKRVPGYRWATCINLNSGVVHGIPDEKVIKDGDVVSVDVGLYYRGFHTDTSTSVQAGTRKDPEGLELLRAGQEALQEAIRAARPGNRVGHISAAMEAVLSRYGYNPVYTLTGHGVGGELHEFPPIPCFLKGRIEDTPSLSAGMTLAIEAIYVQGSPELTTQADGWTMVTRDGKLAGLFEETIAVTDQGPKILT